AMVGDVLAWHGGWIECHSEPGRGTCFTIRLPTTPPEPEGLPGGRKVLVVESEPEVLRLSGLILELAGYQPVLLSSAEELSQRLRLERPALVVLEQSDLGPDPQRALALLEEEGLD